MTDTHLIDSPLHLDHGAPHRELVSAAERHNAFGDDLRVFATTPPSNGTQRDTSMHMWSASSSEDGGIELFPLLRDCARASRATCSRSAAIWSACAPTASRSSPARSSSSAIRASRAAQAAQSGAAGGRADTSHDHPEPALSKQADTLSPPAEPASCTTCHRDTRNQYGS